MYRIALSNSRLEKLQQRRVTFGYRKSGSREWKRTTLEVQEFMRRFLQHVLPF
ncbi:MAG: transposase [Acidobacteriota bacterium]